MKLEIIKVSAYTYEKVMKPDVEISIPQTSIFFQEFNHRRITGVFPQKATWDNNKIWELKIIEVTDKTITTTILRTNDDELSTKINFLNGENKTAEDYLCDKVVSFLMKPILSDLVSNEIFEAKFLNTFSEFSKIINEQYK